MSDEKYLRNGKHLLDTAKSLGWDENGDEGAIEFIIRRTREVAIEDCGASADKQEDSLRKLDMALCNFTNAAGDPWDPVDKWRKEVDDRFAELSDAYNEAHESGVFSRITILKKEHKKMLKAIHYVLDGYGFNAPDFREIEGETESDWITDELLKAIKPNS